MALVGVVVWGPLWGVATFTTVVSNGVARVLCGTAAEDGALDVPSSVDGVRVVEIAPHAFEGCTNLTSVTLAEGVTAIGKCAFDGCVGLTNITFAATVETIGESAFRECSGLSSVTLPSALGSLGAHAFERCTGLVAATLPTSDFEMGDYAFADCSSLRTLTFPEGLSAIGACAFLNCEKLNLVNYVLNESTGLSIELSAGPIVFPSTLRTIGDWAFAGCDVREVTFNDGLVSIGVGAFARNQRLETIDLPASVRTIGDSAFRDIRGILSVTLREGVETIGQEAFGNLTNLRSVTIPSSVTTLGDSVFATCKDLAEIRLVGAPPVMDKYHLVQGYKTNYYNAVGLYPMAYASDWTAKVDEEGRWNSLLLEPWSYLGLGERGERVIDDALAEKGLAGSAVTLADGRDREDFKAALLLGVDPSVTTAADADAGTASVVLDAAASLSVRGLAVRDGKVELPIGLTAERGVFPSGVAPRGDLVLLGAASLDAAEWTEVQPDAAPAWERSADGRSASASLTTDVTDHRFFKLRVRD